MSEQDPKHFPLQLQSLFETTDQDESLSFLFSDNDEIIKRTTDIDEKQAKAKRSPPLSMPTNGNIQQFQWKKQSPVRP